MLEEVDGKGYYIIYIYIYGGKDLSRDANRLQYNEWRILSKTAKIWGFVRAMMPQLGSSHPLLLRFGDVVGETEKVSISRGRAHG